MRIEMKNAPVQFYDLPDELIEMIIDHSQPGFDHRSRVLAQDICRQILIDHEHDSLVTERILAKLWFISTPHLQYYTFLQKLGGYLSPDQLLEIGDIPLSERIRRMALVAQENQDYSLVKITNQITNQITDHEIIMLQANRIRKQEIINFNDIIELHISDRGIDLVPDEITQFHRLILLNLNWSRLRYVPDDLNHLSNLRQLYLNHNQLTSIPASLGHLSNLMILNLSNNLLTSIPDSLGNLIKISYLDLSGNYLTSLPDSLGRLQSLKKLFLDRNQLRSVPASLGELRKLKILNLSTNWLTFVPDSLGQLQCLEKLHLDQDVLKNCPDSLWLLPNLICVVLVGRVGRMMRRLEYLMVSQYDIEFDPDERLFRLHYLDFHLNCHITKPDTLSRLIKIYESKNEIL